MRTIASLDIRGRENASALRDHEPQFQQEKPSLTPIFIAGPVCQVVLA